MTNLCEAIECPYFKKQPYGCDRYFRTIFCHLLFDSKCDNESYSRTILVEDVPVKISNTQYALYVDCDQKIIDALKAKNESFLNSDSYHHGISEKLGVKNV